MVKLHQINAYMEYLTDITIFPGIAFPYVLGDSVLLFFAVVYLLSGMVCFKPAIRLVYFVLLALLVIYVGVLTATLLMLGGVDTPTAIELTIYFSADLAIIISMLAATSPDPET